MDRLKKVTPWMVALVAAVSACATTPSLTREQKRALVEILEILDTSIQETQKMVEKSPDPTSQHLDILEKLNTMKEILDRIEAGKAPYDEKLIRRYRRKTREIEANIRNSVDKVFSSDVFFKLGRYKVSELSEEGKRSLKALTESIIESQVRIFQKLFPDRPLTIEIKAVGYADETPPGPELAERLKREIDGPLPGDPVERKKVLNKKLSHLRAQAIFEYIEMEVESLRMENVSMGESTIIGLGETLPFPGENAEPPYQPQDERRRICKIYSRITVAAEPEDR